MDTTHEHGRGSALGPARSSLLDLLRGTAALLVALHHLRSLTLVARADLNSPPSVLLDAFLVLAGFGPTPVIVFFVLSGYLVGGSLLRMPPLPASPADFLLRRVLRLWLVLVPACALTLLLAGQGVEECAAGALAGNLAFLQGILVHPFGGNFPLWSLGAEFWCYVLFLAGWMGCLWRGAVRWLSLLALAGLLLALPAHIKGYFPLWFAGAAIHFLPARGQFPRAALAVLFINLLGVRLFGSLTGEWGGNLVIAASTAWAIHSCTEEGPLARMLRATAGAWARLAAFSFSLYVLHIPLYTWMLPSVLGIHQQAQPTPRSLTALCVAYASVVALSAVFAWFTERHTNRIRAWLFRRLGLAARFRQ